MPVKYHVVSTYPPALVNLSPSRTVIVAGSIVSINGKALNGQANVSVPSDTVLSQLTWSRPAASSTPTLAVQHMRVPGKPYVITISGTRRTCTCPGFTYRKTCKHITM